MIDTVRAGLAGIATARATLGRRPVREIAEALAAAALRWRDDPALRTELGVTAGLSGPMLDAVVPLVAEMLDADALVDLHHREGSAAGPALVAYILASNVPGLAVPAIAHACLAGAAVLVKSGRADRASAPAFARALAAVDPELGATILPVYWPGGSTAVEDAVLATSEVVVATGTDATTAALARRFGPRLVAYGTRSSVAVVAGDAPDDDVAALALDAARYEQRGCLSPRTVFVAGDPYAFADRVVAALGSLAADLPPPTGSAAEQGNRRLALETARFRGATVVEGRGGAAVLDVAPWTLDEVLGARTLALHAIRHPADAIAFLPTGTIECVGVGAGVRLDAEALRRRGVARVCPLGRMQRPRIDWPRGQRPALGALFRASGEPRIQVES